MDGNVDWKNTLAELNKVNDQLDELDQRLQVLATLVEATMEQMSGLMDMMVQSLPTRTSTRSFTENPFSADEWFGGSDDGQES
jgi:Tfp pilus assembly protein PilN